MTDVNPANHDCFFKGEKWHDEHPEHCNICHTGYEMTINRDGIECPYCGYVDCDSWEWCQEDEEKHECGNCRLVFDAHQCVMVDYRAEPLPEGERSQLKPSPEEE